MLTLLPDDVGLGVAEHQLRRRIEDLDQAAGVDHDDAVNGGVNHRAPARFGDARRLIGWRRAWRIGAHSSSAARNRFSWRR